MTFVTSTGLTQTATYWSLIGSDGFGGDVFNAPIQIACRWEDDQTVYTSQIDRREYVSNAKIYVDRDMELGGYLYLGTSALSSPVALEGAFKIQRFTKAADLSNLETIRRAQL